MNSDDDDDILLSTSMFSKPKRSEVRDQKKQQQLLDDVLIESEKHHLSLIRIQQVQRENPDPESSKNNNNNNHTTTTNENATYGDSKPKTKDCSRGGKESNNNTDNVLQARVQELQQLARHNKANKHASHNHNNNDGDDAFSPEKRRKVQKAVTADQCYRLGLWRAGSDTRGFVVGGSDAKTNSSSGNNSAKTAIFFYSMDDAMQNLQDILENNDVDGEGAGGGENDGPPPPHVLFSLSNTFCKSMAVALERGFLTEFLLAQSQQGSNKNILVCDNADDIGDAPPQPPPLDSRTVGVCRWLQTAAMSAELGDADLALLSRAATQTLRSWQKQAAQEDMAALSSFPLRAIRLDEFQTFLNCWVDGGDFDTVHVPIAGLQGEEKEAKVKPFFTRNARGLLHFLTLTNHRLSSTSSGDEQRDASQCIATLIRLGLDSAVGGSSMDMQEVLCQGATNIMSLFFETVDSNDQTDWIAVTTKTVLDGLKNLKPNTKSANNRDDKDACLCLSAAVRMMHAFTIQSVARSRELILFQAEFAMQAVYILLVDGIYSDADSFRSFADRVLREKELVDFADMARSSIDWLAITSVMVGLFELEAREDLQQQASKYLAIVECLIVAFESGLLLLSSSLEQQTESSAAEYGSGDNAKSFVNFVNVFDELLSRVSGRALRLSASSTEYQRVNTALMKLQMQNSTEKNRAIYLAPDIPANVIELKQATISSFFCGQE